MAIEKYIVKMFRLILTMQIQSSCPLKCIYFYNKFLSFPYKTLMFTMCTHIVFFINLGIWDQKRELTYSK